MLDISIINHNSMNKELPLLFAMSRAGTVLSRCVSAHGLSFSDFMILHHLSQAPGKRLRRIDLAQKLGLTPSGITRMIIPLEKLHIIARDKDGEDARSRYAVMTEAGEELLRDATATFEMKLADIIPPDSQSKIGTTISLLEDITENMLEPEYKKNTQIKN